MDRPAKKRKENHHLCQTVWEDPDISLNGKRAPLDHMAMAHRVYTAVTHGCDMNDSARDLGLPYNLEGSLHVK